MALRRTCRWSAKNTFRLGIFSLPSHVLTLNVSKSKPPTKTVCGASPHWYTSTRMLRIDESLYTMPFHGDDPKAAYCSNHKLVVCPMCGVDHFADEILSKSEKEPDAEPDADSDLEDNSLTYMRSLAQQDLRIGSGRVIPEKFIPPNKTDTPQLLFPPAQYRRQAIPPVHRFIHRSNPTQVLIYTGGTCLVSEREDPSGGCAFVFKFSTSMEIYGHVAFRLENEGPTGQQHQQTSNRAELRAVIGALRFRSWTGEGFKTVVIATDSEYVVNGSIS